MKRKAPKFVYWLEVNNEDHCPRIELYSVDRVTESKNADGSPLTIYHNDRYKVAMNAEFCHETLQKAYFHFDLIEDALKKNYSRR